jgi:two-component system sensor histidine kinase KdpD
MSAQPRSRLLAGSGRRQAVAGVLLALTAPVVVTVVASIPGKPGTVIPALLYVLGVVTVAAVGRLGPGLLAAALSFGGLDYYFTPPPHTLRVGKAEDLVALGVFFVVAGTVSAALSAALEQRARAEFREHQVRALYNVTARLLSGAGLHAVLEDLATSLQALYDLRGCRVIVVDRDGAVREQVTSGTIDEVDAASIPLVAGDATLGRIQISGGPRRTVGGPEGEVLKAFAGQLALAIERVRLGEMAAGARVEAETNRIRAALFSSVTHDLRTPLASITASASSLLEEGVPFSEDQRRELLRTILEESERLNRLVANLMDLSRLRAGALVPSLESVPLEDVVWSVLERMRPRLGGRPVRVRIRGDVPPVLVDVVQMDQVLTNLVENAARYAPADSEIVISAARWHGMVEIKVADRGPGVPAEERARVFQEFFRRDVGDRRGGTGLGLAIAQAIVLAHGGTMWLEETPGGGATIGFRLPLTTASTPSVPRAVVP